MYYNLEELKAIKCGDIANHFGISTVSKGNTLKCAIRNEKTPSCSIDVDKNVWYDFGSAKGGGPIELAMEIINSDFKTALKALADGFGIEPCKPDLHSNVPYISDEAYHKLGIIPRRVMMNLNDMYNLEKNTEDEMQYYSNKYGMSVRELAKENPKEYNDFVKYKGMERLEVVVKDYIHSCVCHLEDSSFPKEWIQTSIPIIKEVQNLINKALLKDEPKIDFSNLKKMRGLALNPDEDLLIIKEKMEYKMGIFREKHVESMPYVSDLNYTQMTKLNRLIDTYGVLTADKLHKEYTSIKEEYKELAEKWESFRAEHGMKRLNPTEGRLHEVMQLKGMFEGIVPQVEKYLLKMDKLAKDYRQMYADEFPAIRYTRSETLEKAVELNMSPAEIKQRYKEVGKKLGESLQDRALDENSPLYKSFNKLDSIVKEFNRCSNVEHMEKQQAQQNSMARLGGVVEM